MSKPSATVVAPSHSGLEARERILRAAERLFAEKGYAATAVHEITDAAEVNKALLYYYFEDKRSVYVTIIDEGIARFRAMLNKALDQPGSYSDRLRSFIDGHIHLMWEQRDLLRVVHRCVMSADKEVDKDEVGVIEKFRGNLDRLEEFFREAMEAGEFRTLDPAMTARSICGLGNCFAFWGMYDKQKFTEEQVIAHVADLMLGGICAHPPGDTEE